MPIAQAQTVLVLVTLRASTIPDSCSPFHLWTKPEQKTFFVVWIHPFGGINKKYENQWEGWHPIYHGKQKMFQPSGNLSPNYGESPFLMGKSTISMVNHQFCHIKMFQTTNQKSYPFTATPPSSDRLCLPGRGGHGCQVLGKMYRKPDMGKYQWMSYRCSYTLQHQSIEWNLLGILSLTFLGVSIYWGTPKWMVYNGKSY